MLFGVIAAAGKENVAQYAVEGFQRRWDFGGEASNEYAFTIDIDNEGQYLDFTDVKVGESVAPTRVFKCTPVSAIPGGQMAVGWDYPDALICDISAYAGKTTCHEAGTGIITVWALGTA